MLLSTLENVLNRNLPRSPRARQLCAELAGRRIAVEVRGFGAFLVRCDGLRLEVVRDFADVDARWSGGPIALAGFALGGGSADSHPGIEVSGDAEVAGRFRELARRLRIDFEEELALAIGDVPAHELARLARAAAGWSRRAAETTVRNIAEYLAHERRDLVSRSEAHGFLAGVDSARDAIESLEARVDELARRCAAQRPQHREA